MWWRGGIGGTVPARHSGRSPPRARAAWPVLDAQNPSEPGRRADEYPVDPMTTRHDAPGATGPVSVRDPVEVRAVDATPVAATLLARAQHGDALLVAALVPAPSLHVALTPEATTVLRNSLVRIVSAVVGDDLTVPWIHDQVLALLAGASYQDAIDTGDVVRARWHQAWQAPVTVVTAAATVDPSTPASVAVFLAGAQLGTVKDACAHA